MRLPQTAYDMHMLHREATEDSRGDGWAFGLPPGISPVEWPLDPNTGWPLMHGFTLRLPPEYRCHGNDIVAISFFAASPDMNEELVHNPAIGAAMTAATPPDDPALRPFWAAEQDRHLRLHRMTDILDASYALILLTEAEFNGPLCRPPVIDSPALDPKIAPDWMTIGSAASFTAVTVHPDAGGPNPPLGLAVEDYGVIKSLGGVPEARPDFNRALQLTPRAEDPNAGKAPQETWDDGPADNGYQNFFYWEDGKIGAENYRIHDWAKDHEENHLGGTMRPIQGTPEGFGPFYVGFTEDMGGYNFGGGTAQLDFQNVRFDWACG